MKFDLSLLSYNNSSASINDTIQLDPAYFEGTDIRALSDIKVKGNIVFESDNVYELKLNLKGEMTLPCSISLVDVIYTFNIDVDEIIDQNSQENDDYIKIINNTLDIIPIIWQNIVVEIPMRVVSPNLDNAKLEGDGWKLLSEDDKKNELDPRFDKLRDLLDKREE